MGSLQSAHRPWFARPLARTRILDEMRSTGLDVHEVEKPVAFEQGLSLLVYPHIRILPSHSVRIAFSPEDPEMPCVHAKGPDCPAHRNPDGSLCLWYPKDSAARRWCPGDSGVQLLAIIVRHLRWEVEYQRTGSWPGFEAPHGYVSPGLDERDNIVG